MLSVFLCFQIRVKAEAPVSVALMQRSRLNFHLTPAEMFQFREVIASMSSTNPSRVSHPFMREKSQRLEWRLENLFSQSQSIGSTLCNFSKKLAVQWFVIARTTLILCSVIIFEPLSRYHFLGKILKHMFYCSRTEQSST